MCCCWSVPVSFPQELTTEYALPVIWYYIPFALILQIVSKYIFPFYYRSIPVLSDFVSRVLLSLFVLPVLYSSPFLFSNLLPFVSALACWPSDIWCSSIVIGVPPLSTECPLSRVFVSSNALNVEGVYVVCVVWCNPFVVLLSRLLPFVEVTSVLKAQAPFICAVFSPLSEYHCFGHF